MADAARWRLAFSRNGYDFRIVAAADLPMLSAWLADPRIVEWWGDPGEERALIEEGMAADSPMNPFVVSRDGVAFGYLQTVHDIDAYEWNYGAHPEGSVGLDQFIGDAAFLRRGHGAGIVRAAAEHLLAGGVPRVVIDPDPDNAIAVAAYKSAGFTPHELRAEHGVLILIRTE